MIPATPQSARATRTRDGPHPGAVSPSPTSKTVPEQTRVPIRGTTAPFPTTCVRRAPRWAHASSPPPSL